MMRETKNGILVEGLAFKPVRNSKEIMAELHTGNQRRIVAPMKMNARSSRGHGIFTVYIKEVTPDGERSGKLNLVDLAGMESSKKSYPVEGASNSPARREEAKNINVSLYALGGVIEALSKAGRKGAVHVPWRNAKLTRVLQDALGGNSKTSIIVALRSEAENIEETIQTLRFAQHAKAVKTVVKAAEASLTPKQLVAKIDALTEQLGTSQLLVRTLQQEIERRDEEDGEGFSKLRGEAGILNPPGVLATSAGASSGLPSTPAAITGAPDMSSGGASRVGALKGGRSSKPGATPQLVEALYVEILLLTKKNRRQFARSLLARVVKGQMVKAIATLRVCAPLRVPKKI